MNFMDERVPDRFWMKCSPCPVSGCWLWCGAKNRNGYGSHGRAAPISGSKLTHRYTYEIEFGSLPTGTELDHRTCSTRECVNPAHLEPVTHAENVRRGKAKKTHCVRGHELKTENLMRANGDRTRCRLCYEIATAERCALKRELTASRPKPKSKPKKTSGVCIRGHAKRFNGKRLQCDECTRQRYLSFRRQEQHRAT